MKKIKISRILLALIILNISSCSSSQLLIPKLANRTLRIHPDRAGLFYQYQICSKKLLFVCFKKEWVEVFYNLEDKAVRDELINLGFVLTVDEMMK